MKLNPTTIVSALIEAWQEVRVQKARVILSLVGVVAAVAAMSTVMAIGEIIVQSQREEIEAMTGRDATVVISISQNTSDADMMMGGVGMMPEEAGGDAQGQDSQTSSDLANAPLSASQRENMEKLGWPANDIQPSVFTKATAALASRYKLTQYSRSTMDWTYFEELTKAVREGHFRGRPVNLENLGFVDYGDGNSQADAQVTVQAVDPAYKTLFRLRLDAGRWIEPGDVNQRVTPVVVNTVLWRDLLGSTPLNEPVVLTNTGTGQQVRVVGVVRSSQYSSPTIYMNYDAWELAKASNKTDDSWMEHSLAVWVKPAQAEEARQTLPAAMNSLLGSKYKAQLDPYMSMMIEESDSVEDGFAGVKLAIMVIGAIVIFLGALGLLNVAIVTVRQRIREIGIRRAVGASAKRIFFAVFLESVVATFVAGVIGVVIAIVVFRLLPLDAMYIELQDTPGFPMNTALVALAISTGIGALAGIIPAVAAVKVKPIDAIRY